MSGLAAHLGGRFASALDHLATAERIFRDRCVGAAWELNAVRHFTLECFYYLGALERFRTEAAEGLKEAHDRGSVYASTTLRIGLANVVWLLGDDPERAKQETHEAMAAWSAQGYHIQHWYQLIAETQIDLYQGDGEKAYQRFVAGWPALRRSLLLQMQHTRIVAVHLRGRAALAGGLRHGEPRRDARSARARADRLRKGTGWGGAMAALLLCGRRASRGTQLRGGRLDRARHRGDRRARAGAVQGRGADGGRRHGRRPATAAAGETWMRDNGAKAPRSLARMLAPGIAPE